MKQKDFEARVLEIWLLSRVPLTLAHVQHLTGASRANTKKALDAMTVEGVLGADDRPDHLAVVGDVRAQHPLDGHGVERLLGLVARGAGQVLHVRERQRDPRQQPNLKDARLEVLLLHVARRSLARITFVGTPRKLRSDDQGNDR